VRAVNQQRSSGRALERNDLLESYDPERTGNYFILAESNAEIVHLIESDRYFNLAMGGPLPEQPEHVLAGIHDVLDVACGPGCWGFQLAQEYPHMQVTGIDISQNVIDYANGQVQASRLDNVQFIVGNVMQPLEFPDESFDLVNVRNMEAVIPVSAWPGTLKEMFRVTRRGGIIRIVDCEWGVSTGKASEQMMELSVRGMQIFGLSHSPDWHNYGVTPWLHRFLRDLGCVNVQERPSFLDFSVDSMAHQGCYIMFTHGYEMMKPFLIQAGVTTPEAFAQLQQEQSVELLENDFRGLLYILTAWGQKP